MTPFPPKPSSCKWFIYVSGSVPDVMRSEMVPVCRILQNPCLQSTPSIKLNGIGSTIPLPKWLRLIECPQSRLSFYVGVSHQRSPASQTPPLRPLPPLRQSTSPPCLPLRYFVFVFKIQNAFSFLYEKTFSINKLNIWFFKRIIQIPVHTQKGNKCYDYYNSNTFCPGLLSTTWPFPSGLFCFGWSDTLPSLCWHKYWAQHFGLPIGNN